MYIDENKVVEVLASHGLSLEQVTGAKHKIPQAEQDWIYLIHHFHPPKKAEDMESVHHCFMLEKKNMKGKKYEQMHVKEGKIFQHCLRVDNIEKAPKVVYDHLNNEFKIVIKEINKTKYAVISKPSKISNIKWSEQDK